ncbi:MAG: excinuclease ABC subunit UvrC [Candidatus Margulisiibacteriota bacterium]|nr:excinuclease ABC subunit UvrC [Candidatus Margulisiibacteriota bacterium]
MSSLKEKFKSLPNKPGVYLFKDKNDLVIYVGKANALRKRVASYFRKHDDIKTGILLERLYDIDYIVTGSEMDALVLEDQMIKRYKPRYNVAQRDDKAYPLLKLTVNEKWPRLLMVRKKVKDKALYFGRFRGGMVREVLKLIKRFFPVRWCRESPLKMREQPCLYYRIGSCSGPCIGKIGEEEYKSLVKAIALLLGGKTGNALIKLKDEMWRASKKQDYEKASYLRDRIKAFEKMMEGKALHKNPSPRLLSEVKELQKALRLKKAPMRIEGFDISNISGTNPVGSMVTFYGGLPLKDEYRKFKIISTRERPDDVASIFEVVKRRYTGALSKKLSLPDLIMVDGGKGQVESGLKALREAGLSKIPIIGLAKKEEAIYRAGKNRPISLSKRSEALKLLQRIRDEAHRFAIAFHRQRRRKGMVAG